MVVKKVYSEEKKSHVYELTAINIGDSRAILIRKDGKPVLSNIKGNWDELNLVRCGHSPLRRPPSTRPAPAPGCWPRT